MCAKTETQDLAELMQKTARHFVSEKKLTKTVPIPQIRPLHEAIYEGRQIFGHGEDGSCNKLRTNATKLL